MEVVPARLRAGLTDESVRVCGAGRSDGTFVVEIRGHNLKAGFKLDEQVKQIMESTSGTDPRRIRSQKRPAGTFGRDRSHALLAITVPPGMSDRNKLL